jgi:hypothetical protein
MNSKAGGQEERFIKCFDGRVVVFIIESYKIMPGLAREKTAILSVIY